MWSHFFCVMVTNLTELKRGRLMQLIVPESFILSYHVQVFVCQQGQATSKLLG